MSKEVKQTNKKDTSRTKHQNNPSTDSFFEKQGLFLLSLVVSIIVALWGVLSPDDLGRTASLLTSSVLKSLDWFFLVSVSGFVLVCFWLAIGPYGKIKLGKDTDKPEFSLASWMAMLFAAGMGVGLLFWGVSEPVIHFIEPTGLESASPAAARQAMIVTCFHWGLHAWAIYGITALVLAYFGFRKGARYLPGEPIRRVFVGSWVAPVAKSADIVGVLAVSLGIAGSLGMGLMQISSGVQIVAGVPKDSLWLPVLILGLLVAAYMTSATTGLSKGIRLLSNINMWLAVSLMLFLLLAGPTVSLFGGFLTSLGDYSSSLIGMSFRMYPYQNLQAWTHRWTLTFFIFWIAWAPFVGVFIARISKGRTIREFILGVLLVPTLFSILWFSVFGGSAIHEEMSGLGGIGTLVKEDMTVALFTLFQRLPLSNLLSVTAIALIFIFLVTSADSATFVLSMLTSQGNPDPPMRKKIIWGVVLGALGAALMFTGSVEALQAVVVSGAIPFVFVMLLQLAALIKALKQENLKTKTTKKPDPLSKKSRRAREKEKKSKDSPSKQKRARDEERLNEIKRKVDLEEQLKRKRRGETEEDEDEEEENEVRENRKDKKDRKIRKSKSSKSFDDDEIDDDEIGDDDDEIDKLEAEEDEMDEDDIDEDEIVKRPKNRS